MDFKNDKVLNDYIYQLNYWKNIKFNEKKFIELIDEIKLSLVFVEIKNSEVKYKLYNTNYRMRIHKIIIFLNDVAQMYPYLSLKMYIHPNDTLNNNNINIYNVNGKINNEINHDFFYGVSRKDSNYVRILDTDNIPYINSYYPIFCFEKHRDTQSLLFPDFDADIDDIKKQKNIDNLIWEEKKSDIPIFRGKNICCDLRHLDKVKLINFSYNNKEKTNFKFSQFSENPLWGEYLISISHLKLFQNLNIIDKNINIEEFREYFSSKNFLDYKEIFNSKFIVTVGSGKNNKWYKSNSCILENKFKNKEYFYEKIFDDMIDIVYFDEKNLFKKLKLLKSNDYSLAKNITSNRKKKFDKYLNYNNLVKWYGLFLIEYSKLLK